MEEKKPKSESKPNLEPASFAEALSRLQGEIPQIHFDSQVKVQTRTGGTYTFEYATLSNIVQEIKPLLSKHGFAVSQPIAILDGKQVLTTKLMHGLGSIESTILLQCTGNNQERGAEISYMRRYALSAILNIVSDEDDDSNTTISAGFEKTALSPKEPKQAINPATLTPKGDTDEKPWLSEKQFDIAIRRIVDGDGSVYQKTIDGFRMKKEYRAELDKAHEQWKGMYVDPSTGAPIQPKENTII